MTIEIGASFITIALWLILSAIAYTEARRLRKQREAYKQRIEKLDSLIKKHEWYFKAVKQRAKLDIKRAIDNISKQERNNKLM
ncbi:hypothetical protein [Geomicrobium sp. JCM 19037]|uniref:hypothetical protein n=1 Tax=Geomicrobium sp. JCM 19037 TaxID=1460634 RepID=UPI0005A69ED4|nr:hypothetical protein [Geomicrobium sp. JCM 19037]